MSEETYKFFEQQKENYYWIDADDFTSQKLENGMNGQKFGLRLKASLRHF